MPTMTMTKPATEDHLALFLAFVEVVADRYTLAPDVAQRLKLVVEEATTNVVRHAYAVGAEGDLTLVADVDDAAIVVTLEDEGRPFAPEDAPPPDLTSAWQERRVGGLGWHLIRELADDVRYASVDGRNRLTVRIDRAPRA
jgi:serine/threonine-protein kinase RsbW